MDEFEYLEEEWAKSNLPLDDVVFRLASILLDKIESLEEEVELCKKALREKKK